jgi:hypothetical protein
MCSRWQRAGFCTKYAQVKKLCQKSCDACSAVLTQTSPNALVKELQEDGKSSDEWEEH